MFDFDGDHATTVRPPHKDAANPGNWAKDPSGPGANDGTRITASLINAIVGNLRHLLDAYSINLPGSADDAVKLAILAAITEAIENHTHEISTLTDGGGFVRMTDAERAKLASLAANYKGAFADLAAVAVAYPTAAAGDWAVIMLPGEPASIAVWDTDTSTWVDIDNAPPATASTTPFTPSGNVAATNVQAAIEELDAEKSAVGHDHDSRYYTQAAIDTALGGKQDDLGLAGIATQEEAEAGALNDKAMTPLRVKEAIAAQVPESGLVLLNSGVVANAASLDLVLTAYLNDYRGFRFVLSSFVPATDDRELWMRLSTDAGSTYASSSYSFVHAMARDGFDATFVYPMPSGSEILVAGGPGAGEAVSNVAAEGGADLVVDLFDPTDAGKWPKVSLVSSNWHGATVAERFMAFGSGAREVAKVTNAVRFLFETDNIASGNWALYGYK